MLPLAQDGHNRFFDNYGFVVGKLDFFEILYVVSVVVSL